MQVAVSISSMFHAHYEANANTKMLFATLASIVKYLMPKCECWNFCPEVFQDRKLQKSCAYPRTPSITIFGTRVSALASTRNRTHCIRPQTQSIQGGVTMVKKKSAERLSTMQIIGVIQDMDYSNKKLEEENEYLRAHGVNIDKFYAKTMTVEMVAYLHDVHPNTVRKYINCGLIPKHPNSTNGKILIRASDGLTLDFDELRRKSKKLIYNTL